MPRKKRRRRKDSDYLPKVFREKAEREQKRDEKRDRIRGEEEVNRHWVHVWRGGAPQ